MESFLTITQDDISIEKINLINKHYATEFKFCVAVLTLTIKFIFSINHRAIRAGNLIESSDSHLRNHSTLMPV